MDRSAETSRPANSGSTPIQMVGTPAATVTRSSSMSLARATGDRSAPGITRVAPVATPAWARPQALAWNIGTTGSTTSRSQTPIVSAIITPKVWRTIDRCEYTTPLGFPVVPEVYIIDPARFSSTGIQSTGDASAMSSS